MAQPLERDAAASPVDGVIDLREPHPYAASPVSLQVRHTLRVNGRPAGRGRPTPGRTRPGSADARWQVRLGVAWEPDTGEHAWLSVVCEPPRPGVASGVWLVPLAALGEAVGGPVTVGTVRFAPEGPDRLWLEVTASVGSATRPWSVTVPQRWLSGFLAEVAAVRSRLAEAHAAGPDRAEPAG